MLYNKNNLSCAKIASKDSFKPELSSVFFTKEKTVATDSFRLLEVSVSSNVEPVEFPDAMRGITPFLVDARGVSKIKIPKHKTLTALDYVAIKHIDKTGVTFLTVDDDLAQNTITARVIDGKFPDYGNLFPVGAPKAEVTLNGKYLAELLEIMAGIGELNKVTIKLYGGEKPVALFAEGSNQKARGLIMPIRE